MQKDATSSQVSAPEDTPELRRRRAAALAPFGLTGSGKLEVEEAYLEAPDAVDEIIRQAVESAAKGKLRTTPAHVLVAACRKGDHLRIQAMLHVPRRERRTGWRWVRGSHSGTYVQDPEGTDRLPEGYG